MVGCLLSRSPEILLGLPFTEAIDMWSLGCLTVTLYLGIILYPGNSEYDMVSTTWVFFIKNFISWFIEMTSVIWFTCNYPRPGLPVWCDDVLYLQIRYIVETQGQPADHLLTFAQKTCCFFQRDYNSGTSQWKLKVPSTTTSFFCVCEKYLLPQTADGFKYSSFFFTFQLYLIQNIIANKPHLCRHHNSSNERWGLHQWRPGS